MYGAGRVRKRLSKRQIFKKTFFSMINTLLKWHQNLDGNFALAGDSRSLLICLKMPKASRRTVLGGTWRGRGGHYLERST